MTISTKYIGLDVHKESISIAVRNAAGKIVMESLIETKASMILQFIVRRHPVRRWLLQRSPASLIGKALGNND
jgi:hypothetical protein